MSQLIQVKYNEEEDRWFRGDRKIRPVIRKLIRGTPGRRSGMQKVVDNFLIGLNTLKVPYKFNGSSLRQKNSDKVISFGLGLRGLEGIKKQQPVIAAIGFPYPTELPNLCNDYNIQKFLQHSQWVLDFADSAGVYDNSIFDLWQAGINEKEWLPDLSDNKNKFDVLIYNKIYWDKENTKRDLLDPIKKYLKENNYSYDEIKYGYYVNEEYKKKLANAHSMIFLSAGESQGIAYQECLSCNVPIFAWDQGFWLDPARFKYGKETVKASSVPFFDERCGMKFKNLEEFKTNFKIFFEMVKMSSFRPREYILENLTIEQSTKKLLNFYNSI